MNSAHAAPADHAVPGDHAAADAQFDRLFRQVDTAGGFGHREHVHLTWLAVRTYGTAQATEIVSGGLRRVARYARMPQKYHVTMSRAWVLLVARHVRDDGDSDFGAFIGRNDELLDKRLLTRFYRSSTLASPAARTAWVEPDIAPLPGRRAGWPRPGLAASRGLRAWQADGPGQVNGQARTSRRR